MSQNNSAGEGPQILPPGRWRIKKHKGTPGLLNQTMEMTVWSDGTKQVPDGWFAEERIGPVPQETSDGE